MAKQIPISLNPKFEIEIDATLVAGALGLALDEFRQLMDNRKIAQLCERGTGADAGLYRASFYHKDRRVRLVVDARGRLVGNVEC